MPIPRAARPLRAVLLAIAGLLALDPLLFRSGLYSSVLEPDSSTGRFELILRREQQALHKLTSSIREFAARPGVLLADEHAFEPLETPEFFKDAFHLNNAGCAQLSMRLVAEVGKLLK
jgi:hypothetical protein